MSSRFPFTDEESALLSDAQFFRKKAAITKKIRGQLDETYSALRKELATASLLAPRDFDPASIQFVKGEHLESFPYQYLDCPKYFHGTEKCTFRTLFWWGHHVVCAWILDGSLVKRYKKNLVDRFHTLAGLGLELSIAPTLWEWKQGEGYTLALAHDRKSHVAAVMGERSFIKVMRAYPMGDPRVKAGSLPALAQETFRAMAPLVSP
jgi:hypothetical protein